MNIEHIRILEGFNHNKLNDFETRLMDLFFEASLFDLGKLSTIYPHHYMAYEILSLERK